MKWAIVGFAAAYVATIPGAALAGPCAEQVALLEKAVSATDAGSGPSSGEKSRSDGGPDLTGSTTGLFNARDPQVPTAGQAPKTEATVGMNRLTENRAASPQDVRRQLQNEPTSGAAAQTGAIPQDRAKQIDTLLQRAKSADRNNDQAGCQDAVDRLETLLQQR